MKTNRTITREKAMTILYQIFLYKKNKINYDINNVIEEVLENIVIEDSVLANIAGISAMESYGIVGMASKNAADGIFELLRFENLSKGIVVNTEENEISIELHVVLEYGVKISTVGENIIERVKFNIENLTGLEVDNIEVLVEGIRLK